MQGRVKTSRGVVELETSGIGIPILVLHGSPGGLDGAKAMSHFLDPEIFQIIFLSRPGYMNTPLHPNDTSIDSEADLLAAVLDVINVARAGVLSWSGAPCALSNQVKPISSLLCHGLHHHGSLHHGFRPMALRLQFLS